MARPRKTARHTKQAATAPTKQNSGPFEIDMTASAAETYSDLFRKWKKCEAAGDYTNAHCTTFRMVREAVKQSIPANPLDKRYALAGEPSNVFRIKKGRMRICWIASSQMRRVCILFISETDRKEGDVNDPYRMFASMVMSGRFNDVFAHFGVRMPQLKATDLGKLQ